MIDIRKQVSRGQRLIENNEQRNKEQETRNKE
jgi:hypothetical protein